MAKIYMKYNPYWMQTQIEINGKSISNDSMLYKVVKGKRLQEWIGTFPQMLVDETNTVDFEIEFYGMPLDWDDFEDVFKRARNDGVIKNLSLKFVEGKSDEAIRDKIVDIFTALQEGPVDDFRDPKLKKAFADIDNAVFPINVIATMSSGKSTLINALLGRKMMPSKNEACTATITEILDNDTEQFAAVVYDKDDVALWEVPELTYEIMSELNENLDVHKIAACGNIPFLDARSTALMLVDTPGPNNSQNQAHKNTTYRAIEDDLNNLILYVLNGTQLSTNDDSNLLTFVADQIRKGGKQVRDRFLFVINKMDGFNPEEEDIGKAILAAKKYLGSYGIEDPQIFPCSAYTALNIRTQLNGIDIDNLTRSEERKLPTAARDTLPMIDKFIEYESMHLEQYSTLSPSEQRDLNYRLSLAEQAGDTKEQALIHCGIYSIEMAIKAYVKKYAKTKMIKNLVESFWDVLESSQVFVKAQTQIATDEKAAEACVERAAAVKAKIAGGKEAAIFKEKIDILNPMASIVREADRLKAEANRKTTRVFAPYGDVITNRDEAKRLVAQFTMMSSDSIAELTTSLERVINQEVMEAGERLLTEYQKKLEKIDEEASDKELDFDTVDLIRGALHSMKESAALWCSDDFAEETVEEYGKTERKTKKYKEKVGEKEERVFDGTERVQVGTRKVKVGSHQEKAGTRTIKNPKKQGFFGFLKFWEDNYIEEDVYETVDDYEDEAVYDTKVKYKTVMRDIFEERTRVVEKYSVETAVIQSGLIRRLREKLDQGIENALDYANDQIHKLKTQFAALFDELDELIKQKYTELEECAKNQKVREERLEEKRELLAWMENCKAEIDEVLNI